jgi:GDSL-like Lipase/Acylhydrolase family
MWRAVRARRRELLLAASSVLVVSALLAAAELVLRRVSPRYLDGSRGIMVFSETCGWTLRPGFQGLLHDVPTTVGAHGYRGHDHRGPRRPGRARIVMLGDSITFGSRVRDAETFAALVESRSERYEVLNLAVEGYGTDQELLQLEHFGLRYQPDVVVLNFAVTNDVWNNRCWCNQPGGGMPKPYFSLEGGSLQLHDEPLRLSPWRRFARWLQDDSQLYNRLTGGPPAFPPPPPSADQARLDEPTGLRVTVALIQRMQEDVRRAGARLVVVFHPDRPAFEGRSRVQTKLREALRHVEIEPVLLSERYNTRALEYDTLALDFQGHLTPQGHHFAAEEIERVLAEVH